MRLRPLLAALATATTVLAGALPASPAHAASTVFTMTSFSNGATGDDETDMFAYQSTDGLNFTRVGSGKVYSPPSGILRDPSVTKNTADRRYWVAYTDAWHSNTIGLASSADLKKWTFQRNLALPSTVDTSWAPEWFMDTGGSYNLIVHLRFKGGTGPSPYLITARDTTFTTWSTPVPLSGLQATADANYIDSDVIKLGGTYHIFVKNDHTKFIEHATATALAGPYTIRNTGDWAGWGVNREGPSLYPLDNGTWRIVLDGYKDHNYWYSDSSDGFKTWTPRKTLPNGLSGFIRHATVLREQL